jgi:hypothetical protein
MVRNVLYMFRPLRHPPKTGREVGGGGGIAKRNFKWGGRDGTQHLEEMQNTKEQKVEFNSG